MDKEHEEMIIKSFYNKSIQDRVIFELSSEKKRKNSISSRINSISKNGISEKFMIEIPKPNSEYTVIFDLLKKNGAGDTCYVISFNEEIDGKHLNLSYALEQAVGYGMPSLISCITGKLAYLECEQEYGAPQRYILKRD